ncbi:MAG: hypothetical protein P1U74_02230 [Legionellaceae bacterium]|nr:hypothetical protein [Legionellaceae bacterium]
MFFQKLDLLSRQQAAAEYRLLQNQVGSLGKRYSKGIFAETMSIAFIPAIFKCIKAFCNVMFGIVLLLSCIFYNPRNTVELDNGTKFSSTNAQSAWHFTCNEGDVFFLSIANTVTAIGSALSRGLLTICKGYDEKNHNNDIAIASQSVELIDGRSILKSPVDIANFQAMGFGNN